MTGTGRPQLATQPEEDDRAYDECRGNGSEGYCFVVRCSPGTVKNPTQRCTVACSMLP